MDLILNDAAMNVELSGIRRFTYWCGILPVPVP